MTDIKQTFLSLYNATIVSLDRQLSNLEHILKLGETHARERKIDAHVFLQARLAPDMAHLIRQVQIACSMAKNCPHRMWGRHRLFTKIQKRALLIYML